METWGSGFPFLSAIVFLDKQRVASFLCECEMGLAILTFHFITLLEEKSLWRHLGNIH